MGNKSVERPPETGRAGRRKILIVAREDAFSKEVMNYAIHLAERLDYDLIALSVDDERSGKIPERRVRRAASALKREAGRRGIHCDHIIKHGETGLAVEEVNHEIKRVELVITDVGVDKEEVAREVTIPMFSVVSDSLKLEGGRNMESNQDGGKKRMLASTIGYGAATAALYATVFMNSDTVMQYFTKGGAYAALPIATVFMFSFAHGAFASNLWSLLGIEAMKKGALHQVKREVVQKRKQVQKKRTYAYINPFHRIDK